MSAALLSLRTAIATNTLNALQQAALTQALDAIIPSFPTPDELGSALPPPDTADSREWIAALYTIQAEGGAGGATVNAATIIAASGGVLSLTPTAGLVVGQPAIVETFGAEFTLQPIGTLVVDGTTVLASTTAGLVWERGDTVVAEQATAQAAWFIDAVGGNDESSGLNAINAVKTKAEIMRRMGSWSPTIAIAMTMTYVSSEVGGTDPGLWTPNFITGGSLVHKAALPAPSFTGTLNAVTVKNRAANVPLSSTFNATTGAVVLDMLLVNTTRGNSRAFAQRSLGGFGFQLTQPMTPQVGNAFYAGAEVDTWANGDAILGYVLTSVNLATLGGIEADPVPAFGGPSHQAFQLTILDPTAGANPPAALTIDGSASSQLVECVCQRSPAVKSSSAAANMFGNVQTRAFSFVNVGNLTLSAGSVNVTIFTAGSVAGGAGAGGTFLQNDLILRLAGPTVPAGVQGCILGTLFLDQGNLAITGRALCNAATVVYGGAATNFINAVQGTVEGFGTPGAVAAFPLVGGLKINGQANAYSNLTTAGLVATHQVALTPANLDAAAGAAGFGGLAYVPGVGGFYGGAAIP